MSDSTPRLVFSTAPSREEGTRIARRLVEERLAACVNLVDHVHSIYRWQDAVESADEVLLVIKTSAAHLEAVEETLRSLHSYQVPEFLVLPVAGGSPAYLEWLMGTLRP